MELNPWIVVLGFVCLAAIVALVVLRRVAVARYLEEQRRARIAQIEAELDEKARALRERMFEIASALHREGHDARKAMIRASFIASGKLPDEDL